MSFDIKKVIGTVAPFLTAALPGPFAGMANAALGAALGLKPDAKPSDVQAAIDRGALNGDQLLAIKSAEQQFQETMTQLGYANVEKLAELAVQDRQNARERETKLGGDWTVRVLAYSVTLGFFGVLWFMLKHSVPAESRDILLIMLGALQSAWVGVISYYFGSSAGSDKKSDLLAAAPAIEGKH